MGREHRLKDAVYSGSWALLGAAAVLLASVPLNVVVYGTPIPLHLSSEIQKTGAYLAMRRQVLASLFLPNSFVPLFGIAVTVALVSGLALTSRPPSFAGDARSRERRRDDVWLLATEASVVTLLTIAVWIPLWRMTVGGLPPYVAYSLDSVAQTWPFCIALGLVPLLGCDDIRHDVARFLAVGAVLLMLGTLAIIPSTGGAQWSPRYLFVAAPLLAVLASAPAWRVTGLSPSRAAIVRWTARGVLLCSMIAQAGGVLYLIDAKARNARITERLAFLAAPGDVVITDVPWFPQVTATLLSSRRIMLAYAPAQVTEIASRAAAMGFRSLAVVTCTPETGYEAPGELDASQAGCRFERVQWIPLRERVLIFHRYTCRTP